MTVLVIMLVLVALILLWSLGPRPRVVLEWLIEELPLDLAQLPSWVTDRESAFEVVAGAEKAVEFADPDHPAQTDYAVLYLHGFSATRQELAPIPQQVAQALGANCYSTRLTGHGLGSEALGEATGGDWLKDTAESWQIACRLGRKVIVLGCSTGGTLAAWLAQQPSTQGQLAALVLVSPNFKIRRRATSLFTWPWSRYWIRYLAGSYRGVASADKRVARYWTERYPTKVLHELQALVDAVRHSAMDKIAAPTLFIYSDFDRVVDSRYTDKLYQDWGAERERIKLEELLEHSNHVIAGDLLAPGNTARIQQEILAFLKRRGIFG